MATHELRTPLTALQGYLQMLSRSLGDDAGRAREYAGLALGQTRRLADLINDLLDASRLQTGKLSMCLEPVDLAPLVTRVVEVARPLTHGQTISLDADAPLVATVDPGRIEQVLLNLLTNAITHAPGADRIDVRLRRGDGEAVLQVQDYGPGIPAADLANLFSRFYQVSHSGQPAPGGLGLGLYISREIAVAHGGTIEVSSAEGAGTTFTVRLPLATAEHARVSGTDDG